MKMFLELQAQKVKENFFIAECLLSVLYVIGSCLRVLNKKQKVFDLYAQVHRTTRSKTLKGLVEPYIKNNLALCWVNNTPPDLESAKKLIGFGKIQVFGAPSENNKGVIFVKFSETFKILATCFNLNELMKKYYIVLEPSWSGYCDRDILFFTQFKDPVFILAAEKDDYRFLEALQTNVVPVDRGPCDWVNPSLSEPFVGEAKAYDIVMNSNWGKEKRHYVFFEALKKIEQPLKIALIGMPWRGRSMDDTKQLERYFNLHHQITYFECIPFEEVMKINAQSKIAVLMSLKEGSNRAIAEALFCDTPGLVLTTHVGGINKNITPDTGIHSSEAELAKNIVHLLENHQKFETRKWALANIACDVSTRLVENQIQAKALQQNTNAKVKIAIRTNAPEQCVANPDERLWCLKYSEGLKEYLLSKLI